jgi:hypothetical protein
MKIMNTIRFAVIVIVALLAVSVTHAAPDFTKDVSPILREYCAGCHNKDDFDGEFSMDTFAELMKGGENGKGIVAGKPDESLLIKVLTGKSKPKMPPRKEPQLSSAQIEILKQWVGSGAKGPAAGEAVGGLAMLPKIVPVVGVVVPITGIEYSPDGRRLLIARYGSVEIVDAKTRKALMALKGHPGKVNAAHFSKDGVRVISASGVTGVSGLATVWDASAGKKLREFGEGHGDVLYDAEFSPDGELIATAGYDRQIRIWNAESGELVRLIEGHNGAIFDLAFSPDGTILASASGDETIKLWKVSDGQRLDTLNQPQAEQFSVAFTPDGKFVVGAGADNRVRLWRLLSKDKPVINPVVHARFAHEDDIVKTAMSKDGDWLVSASSDGSLKIWTLPDLTQRLVIERQPDLVSGISIAPNSESFMVGRLDGSLESYELPVAGVQIANANAKAKTKPEEQKPGSRSTVVDGKAKSVKEKEPNDGAGKAQAVSLPTTISGAIGVAGDADVYKFSAKAGEEWVLEVNAARSKSPLDSKVEVLNADGSPIERVVLQALRDSWFTFRGKDSKTSADFRLQNWREMELNEYLYANGEVVKLWLYPRGPDSGFIAYPGSGNRHTYFGTSAITHPLGETCYIVRALPPGSQPAPNGLPLFRVYYENDDETQQKLGRDSKLVFTAPRDGEYLARISDVRSFGGKDHTYSLAVRSRKPDFKITVGGANPAISPGSGREFSLKADRMDGFQGAIRVDVSGLPKGYSVSGPIVIEANQFSAVGVINAADDAVAPTGAAAKSTKLTATATIRGKKVTREVGSLGMIKPGKPAKVKVAILPDGNSGEVKYEPGKPIEFTIEPGQTITARVKAERVDFKARIDLGKEGAGRNLPHGVFVDNIGLNGLLIVEEQDERQFFITAAPGVPEQTRMFYLKASPDGGQCSLPAILHVRRPVVTAGD